MAYVHDASGAKTGGASDPVRVVALDPELRADIFEAADECPGECIFFETDASAAA